MTEHSQELKENIAFALYLMAGAALSCLTEYIADIL